MSETDVENSELFCRESEATHGPNFKVLAVRIDEDNEIVFSWILSDIGGGNPHTYVDHQYCGERIGFVNMKSYKLMYCSGCGFRKKIPSHIKTVRDLKNYFENSLEHSPEISRAELLDLDCTMKKKIEMEVENCFSCPYFRQEPDFDCYHPDRPSGGCGADGKLFQRPLLKNPNSIPTWCPL